MNPRKPAAKSAPRQSDRRAGAKRPPARPAAGEPRAESRNPGDTRGQNPDKGAGKGLAKGSTKGSAKSFAKNAAKGADKGRAEKGHPEKGAPEKSAAKRFAKRLGKRLEARPGERPTGSPQDSLARDAAKDTAKSATTAAAKRPGKAPARPQPRDNKALQAAAQAALAAGVQTIAVTADEDGARLDRWFRRRWPAMGLSHLNKICRKGEVRVDGKRVEASDRLKAGNVVRVPPLKLEVAAPAVKRVAETSRADARFIRDITLYEDRKLMVLNKPFGLAVQGGSGTTRHIDGILQGMAEEMGERPVLVHRLDRDTSGVLLIAKTRRMAADLGEVFRSRQARKIYWAIVEGVPRPTQGRISLFLAKGAAMGDDRSRGRGRDRDFSDEPVRIDPEKMRIAKHGEQDAQHSVTYYAMVDKVAPRLAWLSMKPITGRTHQLRAHAEAIGHPIVGDPKYRGSVAPNDPRRTDPMRAIPPEIERKLHLLARRLILPNPSGGVLDVTAPLPPHMKKTFELLGFDERQHDPILDAPEE